MAGFCMAASRGSGKCLDIISFLLYFVAIYRYISYIYLPHSRQHHISSYFIRWTNFVENLQRKAFLD